MEELEFGPQPLDQLMKDWGIGGKDLVGVSTEQLNYKQVQRARKGRKLTLRMMQKVTRALNVCIWYRLTDEEKESYYEYLHRDLFNYAKGYLADWKDPNEPLKAVIRERHGEAAE